MTAAFTAVVVGNPKPASRTLYAANHVATELAGRAPEVGAALLDRQSAVIGDLVEQSEVAPAVRTLEGR